MFSPRPGIREGIESGLFRPRSGIDPLYFSQGKRSNTSFFNTTGEERIDKSSHFRKVGLFGFTILLSFLYATQGFHPPEHGIEPSLPFLGSLPLEWGIQWKNSKRTKTSLLLLTVIKKEWLAFFPASQPIPTTRQALKESPFFSLAFRLPLLLRKEVESLLPYLLC